MSREEHKRADSAAETQHAGRHAAKDGAPVDPLIDLARDPHPGVPDHAVPGDEEA